MESLAVCWLFPGKVVRIDAPCLDCNEPMVIEMRDGVVLLAQPDSIIAHINTPQTEPWPDR